VANQKLSVVIVVGRREWTMCRWAYRRAAFGTEPSATNPLHRAAWAGFNGQPHGRADERLSLKPRHHDSRILLCLRRSAYPAANLKRRLLIAPVAQAEWPPEPNLQPISFLRRTQHLIPLHGDFPESSWELHGQERNIAP
jgi:hypothetical protein